MSNILLVAIRFHDGRYHGMGDGPPSPARLFQALLAGAGLSGPLNSIETDALNWLEQRNPPIIAAPHLKKGSSYINYVPSNDLDAKDGDPRRIGEVRTRKLIRPFLFDASLPLLYAWMSDSSAETQRYASAICSLAERLYQFGRGVDMAWAWGEIITEEEFGDRLAAYPGQVFRPSMGEHGRMLACPMAGSLQSLAARYTAGSNRFETVSQGKTIKQHFAQQPKPRFSEVAYDSPPVLYVYELHRSSDQTSFAVWSLTRASQLVVEVRDNAVARLQEAFQTDPEKLAEIERVLVGRKTDGTNNGPTSQRIKIIPLPSIGHHHADHGIRRVLVEIPADCPLRADDVHWAFSGINLGDPDTDDAVNITITDDVTMLTHYGVRDRSGRLWRTVTPAALPESARRRRINPCRQPEEAKSGAERAAEQSRAASAVLQALRHSHVRAMVETIRVQREPFQNNGNRAEDFANGTRFSKHRLWHVEISFKSPISGSLAIGDGRFLGLGVMAPVQTSW